MLDSRIDLVGLGVGVTIAGVVIGFDWRVGVAISCYALTLIGVRAAINRVSR